MKKRTKFLWTALAVVVLLASAVLVAAAVSERGSGYWISRVAFEWYLFKDRAEIEKETHSGESSVYYFTSYYLNGMLSAVEATHSERLLKKTLHYLDTMVNTAVPFRYQNHDYVVWGPFNITPGVPYRRPNVHYTLQAAVPLARAAAIIERNPDFKRLHKQQADRYANFVRSAVFDFWYRDQYNSQVPWLNTEYVPIWNDNATNIGLCAVFMYDATGETQYAVIAKDVGAAFANKLNSVGRAWIWESNTIPIGSDTDNTPGSVGNQAGVPDTSHANREPMFMVSLHEAGLMFSAMDVRRMAYTLVDNIWNQSTDNPSFSNYINGSNLPYRVYKEPGLNGPIYHGWAFVGGYLPEAQRVLLSALKAMLKGKDNPSLERNKTGYGGMLALSGQILRNFAILQNSTHAPAGPIAK
jgi:hypothetical protein